MTLQQLSQRPFSVPVATSWLLGDLGEAKGKQDFHRRREPEKLRVLREHAIVESAISSNRIEGVVVEPARVERVVLRRERLTDRDEQEVRGYREALDWIHGNAHAIPVSVDTIRRLHFLCHGQAGDAGQFKTRDGDIIEKYPDGRSRIRFKTVPAAETPDKMEEFVRLSRGLPARAMGAAADCPGRRESRLSLHSSLPRWQWPRLPAAALVDVLPPGLRGGPLHQHRAVDRTAQRTILRNAGTQVPRVGMKAVTIPGRTRTLCSRR
jgi:hypothetical protein